VADNEKTPFPVPPGFQSHNHFLAANGIPRDVYFGWIAEGKDPVAEATKAFALQPPTDPNDIMTSHPAWDASWPCTYKGRQFPTYHAMCDALEKEGILRKWRLRNFGEQLGPYEMPERHVLMWLAATGRLAGDDADKWIARVVAPLRHDSEHHSNIRANRREGVDTSSCARCGVDLTEKPTHALIRPKDPKDRPFTSACKSKGFDPSKYHAWCRSCVTSEHWARRQAVTDPALDAT
jgi:hypothetical protein